MLNSTANSLGDGAERNRRDASSPQARAGSPTNRAGLPPDHARNPATDDAAVARGIPLFFTPKTSECASGAVRRPKPKVPRPIERCRQLSAAGQFEDILQVIGGSSSVDLNHAQAFHILLQAIEGRSKKNPQQFARDVLSRVVSFTSFMTLRAHYVLRLNLMFHDSATEREGPARDYYPEVTERLLPRVIELQRHLAELLHAQASVARLWELTGRGRTQGNQCEVGQAPPRSSTGSRNDMHQEPAASTLSSTNHTVMAHDGASPNGNGSA